MKVLFDECVPWPMYRLLASHACTSVQAQGWSGIRNSELLKKAENDFDLLITADQNILYQQNLAGSRSQSSNFQQMTCVESLRPPHSFKGLSRKSALDNS